jgi:REP element-mobilizing transposase RayT
MTLFKDKYRIASARLRGWDYAGAGWYFVTLCTRNQECFFGEIVEADLQLSTIGDIVAEEWQKTPTIRPNVELDEWIVMPNHIHGIIVIKPASDESSRDVPVERLPAERSIGKRETTHRVVSTKGRLKAGSLGAIAGQFKSVCTKRIWAAGFPNFDWQPRFFDHIIRNEKSLKNIRQYIVNNPLKWELDKNNPANLWM